MVVLWHPVSMLANETNIISFEPVTFDKIVMIKNDLDWRVLLYGGGC